MEELWKQLILNKKETKYEVSNLGGVRNKDTQEDIGQVLSGIPQYKYANILEECGTRKLRRVHRLVAEMFIPKVEGKKFVDHIDRDKLNNRVDNLRWVTRKENQANRDNTLFIEHNGEQQPLLNVLRALYADDKDKIDFVYGRVSTYKDTIKQAEDNYFIFQRYRGKTRMTSLDGVVMYNKDISDILGMDYGVVSYRLDNGWTIGQIRLGYIPLFYYEGKPYKHYGDFRKEINMSEELFSKLRNEGKNLDEIREYVKYSSHMTEVFGVLDFMVNHYKKYNTTQDKVKFGMDRGLSLEEALVAPPQRIRKHSVNGVVMKNKDMWIMYGLEPKNTNTKLSKLKCVYKTLEHFGIDTTGLIIEPYLL